MHRDKILPQRMHAVCRIVARGSCCTKRFAEFNGNCESFCSVEQLAAHKGKSPSEDRRLRQKILVQTTRFVVLWGCTWTRISRQPIIATTWYFFQQTLLEPLTVTGASASCFGERYRDVCVCVFFPFILDIKFVGRTSRGHTGFLIHLLSAVRALIFLAKRI